jgi:hypothetical protein
VRTPPILSTPPTAPRRLSLPGFSSATPPREDLWPKYQGGMSSLSPIPTGLPSIEPFNILPRPREYEGGMPSESPAHTGIPWTMLSGHESIKSSFQPADKLNQILKIFEDSNKSRNSPLITIYISKVVTSSIARQLYDTTMISPPQETLPSDFDISGVLEARNICIDAGHDLTSLDEALAHIYPHHRDFLYNQVQRQYHHNNLALGEVTSKATLLSNWTNTRDRINGWLLHSLRATDTAAALHMSMLGDAGKDLDEEKWARLVLKYWYLDEAATGLDVEALESDGAVDSRSLFEAGGGNVIMDGQGEESLVSGIPVLAAEKWIMGLDEEMDCS